MNDWKRLLPAVALGAALLCPPIGEAVAEDEEGGSSAPCDTAEDVGNEGCDEVDHEEEEEEPEDETDDE
jgi:hypothetical protein